MSTEFAALMESFRRKHDQELFRWLAGRRRQTESHAPEATLLLDRLEALLKAGGKRLRPALVAFSFQACGGDSEAQVMPLAMATELLHAYLLIHDDIMDHADTRRGIPAAHAFFAERHRELGLRGDSEDYGTAMAILAGDLAATCAAELFASCRAEPERALLLRRTYFRMSREVIDGQFLEMQLGLGDDPTAEHLEQVLRLKSGLYSVERPVQLGAILAGAEEGTFQALSRYGRAVGEAFQLQDDLLGIFGDPQATGKSVGGDLMEGKFTYVIHHGLQGASPEEEAVIRGVLGKASATEAEVSAAVELLRRRGADEAVRRMIARRSETARGVLAGLDLAPAGKAFLLGLVSYLEERRH